MEGMGGHDSEVSEQRVEKTAYVEDCAMWFEWISGRMVAFEL